MGGNTGRVDISSGMLGLTPTGQSTRSALGEPPMALGSRCPLKTLSCIYRVQAHGMFANSPERRPSSHEMKASVSIS